MSSLTALWNRTFAVLGRVSMYRLVVFALVALAVIAFVLSFFGVLAPSPLELVAAWAALAASCVATDAVAHRLLGKAWRWESSLITVLIPSSCCGRRSSRSVSWACSSRASSLRHPSTCSPGRGAISSTRPPSVRRS
jgi:hypothetical protein